MGKQKKFDHSSVTYGEMADWIKLGDFEEAKNLARDLALFLHSLSQNKEAQQALMKAKVFCISSEAAKLVSERLLCAPSVEKGKSTKSGIELFAKVLVPNKPTKSQFEMRWIATVADLNLEANNKNEYKRVTGSINSVIDANNQIISDWKNGNRKNYDGFSPGIPKRRITPDQLENYYRKFKSEIDAANGVTRHRAK